MKTCKDWIQGAKFEGKNKRFRNPFSFKAFINDKAVENNNQQLASVNNCIFYGSYP